MPGEENEDLGSLILSGSKRIWRAWRIGFVIALIIGIIVFGVGLSVEVKHKRTTLPGEEPLQFFQISDPVLAPGMNAYTITVENNQLYTIEELTLEFRGVGTERPQDLLTDVTGTVGPGESGYHNFTIPSGAQSAGVDLDGEELIGFTNIDLFMSSPGGAQEWSSESVGSNDESIDLTVAEIQSGGYGDYDVTVTHVSGLQDVSYTLSTRVTFMAPVVKVSDATAISPQGAKDFSFLLDIDPGQLGSVQFYIKAKVNIGENFNMEIWRLYSSDWGILEQHTPTPDEEKGGEPWGPVDTTGLLSIIAYAAAVVTGFIYLGRLMVFEATKPKWIGPIHCYVSLMSLIMAVVHTCIALQKDWPWTSPGMIFSYLAIINLFGFTVFSFYDVEGKKYIGDKKWRYLHLFLLILLVLWVVLHIGYVGDHLGFLK